MRATRRHRLLLVGAALLLCLGGSTKAWAKGKKRVPIAVVVSKKVERKDISLKELKKSFDGSLRGRNQIPINQPAKSPLRVAFDKKVLGMSPSQIGRYWIDRKIRGQKGAPRSLGSSLQVLRVVAKFPAAIGYVRADEVPSWVKVITVSGHDCEDEDYPLYMEIDE